MKTPIKNLTPHVIRVADSAGSIIVEFPPSGERAEIDETFQEVIAALFDEIEIPVGMGNRYSGQVRNLPPYDGETIYLVSGMVISALLQNGIFRRDVWAPATGPNDNALRKDGQVYAVRRFVAAVTNDEYCKSIPVKAEVQS